MAKQVDPKLAAPCVDLYQKVYTSPAIDTILAAYTSSVSFTVGELNTFLADRDEKDIIKIMPGIYTPEYAEAYDVQAGRMSVFLYPVTASEDELGSDPPPPEPDPKNDPLNLGNETP